MPSNGHSISHYISSYYAPRGRSRIYELGMTIAQSYLSPFDSLIGIMGDPGCGKSALVKGMFPGLELTNDDDGVNVRPLPLLSVDEDCGFFSPHTYHLDVRFETGFSQLSDLADAIMEAIHRGTRVVCEQFELIYPLLPINADLLIGIGEEVLIARPTIFGPEPQYIYDIVHRSLPYRLMAHTAEDLCEHFLKPADDGRCMHGDVHRGFTLIFDGYEPDIPVSELYAHVQDMIARDLPVTYYDDNHITIGTELHHCTGPRTHVRRTSQVENFHLLPHYIYDRLKNQYILVGCVGEDALENLSKLEHTAR